MESRGATEEQGTRGRITRDGTRRRRASVLLQSKIFLQASLNYSRAERIFLWDSLYRGDCRRPRKKKAPAREKDRKKARRRRSDGKKRLRWGSEGLIVDSRANAIGPGNPTKSSLPTPATKARPFVVADDDARRPSAGALLSAMRTFSIELPASIARRYPRAAPSTSASLNVFSTLIPLALSLFAPCRATTIFLIAIVRS